MFCVTWLYHILTWSVLCNRFCFMYWHLKNSWTKYAVYVLFTICTVLCIDIWRIPEQHAVICIDIWRIREQHTLFFAFTHWHMKNSWTAYTLFCIYIWRIREPQYPVMLKEAKPQTNEYNSAFLPNLALTFFILIKGQCFSVCVRARSLYCFSARTTKVGSAAHVLSKKE